MLWGFRKSNVVVKMKKEDKRNRTGGVGGEEEEG